MTTEYHKIDAPFKRDKKGVMLHGDWCRPDFEYLADNQWEWTEKVDGTNIRIHVDRIEDCLMLTIGGRTDNAQIPPALLDSLNEIFGGTGRVIYNGPTNRHPLTDCIGAIMVARGIDELVIYGEGYGPKINGGGKYADKPDFVVFDIKVGNWWLTRDAVEDFCAEVGLHSVPIIMYGTISDAIAVVSGDTRRRVQLWDEEEGVFNKRYVSEFLKSEWGDFEAEGLVGVPAVPLFNRAGNRIITKVKAKDFR